MNRIAIAFALAFAASCVQAQDDASASDAAAAASEDTIVVRDDPEARAAPEPGCIRESGTLLRKRDKKGCTGAPGQSYDRGDIERTGAIDTGDAIRKLSTRANLRRGG